MNVSEYKIKDYVSVNGTEYIVEIKYKEVDEVWFASDGFTGVFVWNENKDIAKKMLLEAVEDYYNT